MALALRRRGFGGVFVACAKRAREAAERFGPEAAKRHPRSWARDRRSPEPGCAASRPCRPARFRFRTAVRDLARCRGPFEVVAGRDQPVLEGAVLRQLLGAAEGGDDGLARSAVDVVVLDDLEILGPAREFAAKEHEGACVSITTFIAPLCCLHNL